MPANVRPSLAEPRVAAVVNGVEVSTLVDTGAGTNFISMSFARRMSLKIDRSSHSQVELPNRTTSRIVGTVLMPFQFKGESETYELQFQVLARSLYDVVIGGQFLKHTETLTRHMARRVQTFYRKMTSALRVNFVGSQGFVGGRLDGRPVSAMPDTGSDVTLISAEYARQRGFTINKGLQHRKLLQFMDGSTAYTSGVVQSLDWEYHATHSEKFNGDFYVLDGLNCDVLLGFDFVQHTGCFERYLDCHFEIEQDDECWQFNGIKEKMLDSQLAQLRRQEAQALHEYEKAQLQVERLPEDQQEQILGPLRQRYQELMHKNRHIRRSIRNLPATHPADGTNTSNTQPQNSAGGSSSGSGSAGRSSNGSSGSGSGRGIGSGMG